MTTLNELKEKYLAEQKAIQEQNRIEAEAKELEQKKTVQSYFERITKYLAEREDVSVEELTQYGSIEGSWSRQWEGEKRVDIIDNIHYALNIPECTEITFSFGFYEKKLRPSRNEWVCFDNYRFETLAPALDHSAKLYQSLANQARKNEEWEAEKKANREIKTAQEKQKEYEHQALFNQIANNPTALALLKLFIQIQSNCKTLNSQIEELEEAYETAEYYNSERVSRLEQQASEAKRQASEAESKVNSLQYDIYDLEDKVEKASSRW